MNSSVVSNWHKVRFLESASNLKPLLRSATGRSPAAGLLREVSACLQQGRLYYESASTAALEIRPLLVYYGFLAFARATVLSRNGRRLSTLARGHGLKDKPNDEGRIAEMTVGIQRSGTFSEFNDVVRHFSRLYERTSQGELSFVVPASASLELHESEWTFMDLLSRLPDVRELCAATFRSESRLLPVRIVEPSSFRHWYTLIIEEPVKCEGLPQLSALVGGWRKRFPGLRQWRFESAYLGWDQITVRFASLVNDQAFDEFSEAHVRINSGEHETRHEMLAGIPHLDVATALAPMGGGFLDRKTYLIESRGGLTPSEFSLHLMVLFALSSLVRYRPDMWVHAISRSALSDRRLEVGAEREGRDEHLSAIHGAEGRMHSRAALSAIFNTLNQLVREERTIARS